MLNLTSIHLLCRDGTGGWGVLGSNGMLSFGSFVTTGQTKSWALYELPVFLMIGGMGGLIGAVFNGFNKRLTLWRREFVPATSPLRRFIEVVFITALNSALKFTISYVLGTCILRPDPNPQLPYSADLQSFYCSPEYYNDVASMFM